MPILSVLANLSVVTGIRRNDEPRRKGGRKQVWQTYMSDPTKGTQPFPPRSGLIRYTPRAFAALRWSLEFTQKMAP